MDTCTHALPPPLHAPTHTHAHTFTHSEKEREKGRERERETLSRDYTSSFSTQVAALLPFTEDRSPQSARTRLGNPGQVSQAKKVGKA